MNAKRLFILAAWLAGWWMIVGLWPASGEQAPPTGEQGGEDRHARDHGPRS